MWATYLCTLLTFTTTALTKYLKKRRDHYCFVFVQLFILFIHLIIVAGNHKQVLGSECIAGRGLQHQAELSGGTFSDEVMEEEISKYFGPGVNRKSGKATTDLCLNRWKATLLTCPEMLQYMEKQMQDREAAAKEKAAIHPDAARGRQGDEDSRSHKVL